MIKVMWGNPIPFHQAKSIERNIKKNKYLHNQLKKAF